MADTPDLTDPAPSPPGTKPGGAVAAARPVNRKSQIANRKSQDALWVRVTLTSLALLVLMVLVIIPVVSVFYEALSEGLGTYWRNLTGDPDTRHAILLTLTVAPLAVLCNLVFGVAAAWAITRFRFRGRTLLVTAID